MQPPNCNQYIPALQSVEQKSSETAVFRNGRRIALGAASGLCLATLWGLRHAIPNVIGDAVMECAPNPKSLAMLVRGGTHVGYVDVAEGGTCTDRIIALGYLSVIIVALCYTGIGLAKNCFTSKKKEE